MGLRQHLQRRATITNDTAHLSDANTANLTEAGLSMFRYLLFDRLTPLRDERKARKVLDRVFPKEGTAERQRVARLFANCTPRFDRPVFDPTASTPIECAPGLSAQDSGLQRHTYRNPNLR